MKKKLLAALLCACLIFSLTGCELSTPANVLNVNEQEIPAGIYLLYQLQAYTEALGEQEDSSVELLNDTFEGVAAKDYILEKTVDSCKRYVWINQQFDVLGLSFTDEELATMKVESNKAYEYNGDWLAENGVGAASYYSYYECGKKYTKVFEAYQAKEENAVAYDDAIAYMEGEYANCNQLVLLLTDKDAEALDDDSVATITEIANEMITDLKAGEKFDDLDEDVIKSVFEITGHEFSDTTMDTYRFTSLLNSKIATFDDENFIPDLINAEVGTVGYTTLDTRILVYEKLPIVEDEAEYEEKYKESIETEMQSKTFEEALNAEIETFEVEQYSSAISAYSVKNINY